MCVCVCVWSLERTGPSSCIDVYVCENLIALHYFESFWIISQVHWTSVPTRKAHRQRVCAKVCLAGVTNTSIAILSPTPFSSHERMFLSFYFVSASLFLSLYLQLAQTFAFGLMSTTQAFGFYFLFFTVKYAAAMVVSSITSSASKKKLPGKLSRSQSLAFNYPALLLKWTVHAHTLHQYNNNSFTVLCWHLLLNRERYSIELSFVVILFLF